jgi:hypothetical protein
MRNFGSKEEEGESLQTTKPRNQSPASQRLKRGNQTPPEGRSTNKELFAHLRSEMDVTSTLMEDKLETPNSEDQQPSSSKAGRPPPIILTFTVNLIQLQRNVRDIVKGDFEFRNKRSGTRIITKNMEDFSAVRKYLEGKNLLHFTFFHKSENPIKGVIRQLPLNTPAQDISDGPIDLDFDIISVKNDKHPKDTG